MGGFFSKPKAPAPPPGPSQAELDSIARREKQAEETKARESREIAARKRTRREPRKRRRCYRTKAEHAQTCGWNP